MGRKFSKIVGVGAMSLKKTLIHIGIGLAGSMGFLFLVILLTYVASDVDNGKTQSYIDKNNSAIPGSEDGRIDITGYSVANSACIAYYKLLSSYTVLQEYTDENGQVSYIPYDDRNAKQDEFNRDKDLVIDPNILYAMNEKVFSYEYVYPESFLKPVAHNDSYELLPVYDDEKNKVSVESDKRDEKGTATGKDYLTSDYGISTVCTYKTLNTSSVLKGQYDRVLKVNKTTGEEVVEQLDSPISFEYVKASNTIDVLDRSVSMWQSVKYEYNQVSSFAEPSEKGSKSNNPQDNVEYIRQADETTTVTVPVTENLYVCFHKYAPNAPKYYFRSVPEVLSFLSTHPAYDVYRDASGNPTTTPYESSRTYDEVWEVYYGRSSGSGVYVTSYACGEDKVTEYDNQYLYDYLANFTTYRPMVERTYETFRTMSTQASDVSYRSAAANGTDSGGALTGNSGPVAFIEMIAPAVQEDAVESGILPSITIAQAILESGSGTSSLSKNYNNFFGMKASQEWINSGGQTVDMDTREEDANGNSYYITATWCVFEDFLSCIRYHSRLLWNSKSNTGYRYRDMVGCTDYVECANILKNGGYATDTAYVTKLCSLIENYNLTQYDTVTWCGEIPEYASGGSFSVASSDTSSVTASMSEQDRQTFYDFFHAVDDPYDGTHLIEPYMKSLSVQEVDDMLRLANSFSFRTTLDEEELTTHADLLKQSVLSKDRKDVTTTESEYHTGNRIVDVAMGEVGTAETPLGSNQTKYNTWAGLPGAAWCNIFVCWCANECGYLNTIIPQLYGCQGTKDWYEQRGLYHERDSGYVPKVGDLVIMVDKAGVISHIGIASGFYNAADGSLYIETVEGNSGNMVKLRQKEQGYLSTSSRIHGYCEVPYTD